MARGQAADGDRAVPDALTEPDTPVRGRWITLLLFANIALWLAFYAPIQVLLPRQAEMLAGANKELVFGIVTGIGAAVSVFANPLAGLASDRTCSRFGRRHPWTLAGASLGAAGLAILAGAGNIIVMTLGWCLVQAGLNAMLATLTAALPDRVPVFQRARVGGVIGISQMLGTVLGTLLVTVLVAGLVGGYLACAVLVLAGAVLFVLRTPDAVLPKASRPRERFTEIVAKLWVSPRRHPDFGWAWGCHFLIGLGNALGTLYLLFFLDDAVGHPDPGTGLLILMGLYGAALLIGAGLGGKVSDSSGRRKPYVLVAVALMALAALLLVLWQTWTAALVAAPLLGAGYGLYWAVAMAILTQVLPAASARAKDLGVVNIANALPQVLAPLLATVILGYLGGYPGLFAASALATCCAGGLITRVRAVR